MKLAFLFVLFAQLALTDNAKFTDVIRPTGKILYTLNDNVFKKLCH